MSKKKENKETKTENSELDQDRLERSTKFREGLEKLIEETQMNMKAQLNYSLTGIVPYLQMVDLKENNEDTEQTQTKES